MAEETKKALELKKHVAVIHSTNKLSLLQRKIANALLFNAYADLLNKDEHQIHITMLCRLIGYDSNDHQTIKKSLVNLLSTVLEWNLVDGEKLDTNGVWNASSIIADASINGAVCTYSYSNKMRKLLYRPNIYGRLDMCVQAKFQSSYGLALYENCNRFQDIGKSPWFDIQKFRKLMGVDGNKYLIFRDFKTRVLDKAVEEVNKYSSLNIDLQLRRQHRKVVAIQFLIKKAPQSNLLSTITPENQRSFRDELKLQYGLSKKQTTEMLQNYEEDYIKQKMKLIEESPSFKTGKIKNLAKYLFSALKEDYQSNKSSQYTCSQIFDDQEVKRHEQMKMQAYRRYQDKQLLHLFSEAAQNEKSDLLIQFETYLGKGMYRDIYSREGMNNILIQDQLCLFLRQKMPMMMKRITSYDEWLTMQFTPTITLITPSEQSDG